MNNPQTDNTHLQAKIKLRMAHLPDKSAFKVLDAFYGQGRIWKYIVARVNKKIEITAIDKKANPDEFVLFGDNQKFFPSISLEHYDVIDLDGYGVPFDQLEYIFDYDKKKKCHHYIFVTFILAQFGRLPMGLLRRLGYSEKMIDKSQTLFNRNQFEKFKEYLALMGINRVFVKSDLNTYYPSHRGRRYYLFFET